LLNAKINCASTRIASYLSQYVLQTPEEVEGGLRDLGEHSHGAVHGCKEDGIVVLVCLYQIAAPAHKSKKTKIREMQ
jgi:hypothetical protein